MILALALYWAKGLGKRAALSGFLFAFSASQAYGLSAHNCQVIYTSLPSGAASTEQPRQQYAMMKELLSGLYLEQGKDTMIKSHGQNRYYFASDLMARALGLSATTVGSTSAHHTTKKTALIFSLKELDHIDPRQHQGVHFIFAGQYQQPSATASATLKSSAQSHQQRFGYLSQRFAENGWSLSFLLGQSWQHNLRTPEVMMLRRLAKLSGGRGLTFFKRDVASCLRSVRPNPDFALDEHLQHRQRVSPVVSKKSLSNKLRKALSDPDFRTL